MPLLAYHTISRAGAETTIESPNHETLPFTGAHEGAHPLLQTATANNNLLPVTDPTLSSGYRFFLDTARTLPAGRAREAAMDAEPWTYRVMAPEVVREGRIEPVADPLAVHVGGRWYTSHHGTPDWSIQRADPAATTVELPPGPVEAVKAIAVPVGMPPAGWRIDVRSINRGFFLGADYLPGASLLSWSGRATLTAEHPEAVLWMRNW